MTAIHPPAGQPSPEWIARAVAGAVGDKLLGSGAFPFIADALISDPELAQRDFTELGLSSVDWMDVATRLEDLLHVEIPDDVLLDADKRSVAGWGEHICRLLSMDPPTTAPSVTNREGSASDTEVNDETD